MRPVAEDDFQATALPLIFRRPRRSPADVQHHRQRGLPFLGGGVEREQPVLLGGDFGGRQKQRPLGLAFETLNAIQPDVIDDHPERQIVGLERNNAVETIALDRQA